MNPHTRKNGFAIDVLHPQKNDKDEKKECGGKVAHGSGFAIPDIGYEWWGIRPIPVPRRVIGLNAIQHDLNKVQETSTWDKEIWK